MAPVPRARGSSRASSTSTAVPPPTTSRQNESSTGISRRASLLRVEADGGLPERAPVVDQADEGQRGVEEGRGVGREAVERLLRGRVEQPRRPDRRNTLGVADGVHDTEG